jgi:hypothetical protein
MPIYKYPHSGPLEGRIISKFFFLNHSKLNLIFTDSSKKSLFSSPSRESKVQISSPLFFSSLYSFFPTLSHLASSQSSLLHSVLYFSTSPCWETASFACSMYCHGQVAHSGQYVAYAICGFSTALNPKDIFPSLLFGYLAVFSSANSFIQLASSTPKDSTLSSRLPLVSKSRVRKRSEGHR